MKILRAFISFLLTVLMVKDQAVMAWDGTIDCSGILVARTKEVNEKIFMYEDGSTGWAAIPSATTEWGYWFQSNSSCETISNCYAEKYDSTDSSWS